MSDATIMRPPRRAPEYVANPDMAAFTIGQIALVRLREDGVLSVETLHRHLARIASGQGDAVAARVTADMALGALRYIENSLRNQAA
ncbi:hypothetical protein BDE18_1263 [Paracoccus pantotrophus]|nr:MULTISPECIES: hypothetical protein [Paracoccus]RKS51974.1 hypothetical protein BDE18_1263 [Paracoccus pantotrophus]UFM64119.1 hypothetical protein LOS78_01155 [Paracoccus sp. MA]